MYTEPKPNSIDVDKLEADVWNRIIHVLKIYPKLSPTMLQVGIGTAISPAIWHPVLEAMLEDRVVDKKQEQHKTKTGRIQVYTILSLVVVPK